MDLDLSPHHNWLTVSGGKTGSDIHDLDGYGIHGTDLSDLGHIPAFVLLFSEGSISAYLYKVQFLDSDKKTVQSNCKKNRDPLIKYARSKSIHLFVTDLFTASKV